MGLSILSLNQLADHVAQAEALSAEIAHILMDFRCIRPISVDVTSPLTTERAEESVVMKRSYTPIRT